MSEQSLPMVADDRPEGTSRPKDPPNRRAFLLGASSLLGLTAASLLLTPRIGSTQEVPVDPTKVPGALASEYGTRSRFEQSQRLTKPQRSRTPLQDLYGIITPSALHFERHHNGVPLIDPSRHRLLVHGLVEHPMIFTMDELKRFPATSRIAFVECSGNSGKEWKGPKGTTVQEIHGLTSTSEWTGVRLSTVLQAAHLNPQATWMLAEGSDAAAMTRSVPLDRVMDEALLCYAQNGEPIRPEQGYPLRLLLPGWEGNTCIKWLRRLKLVDSPMMTREETSKYTDLMPDGTARQFTFDMEAKSVITNPSGGQQLTEKGFTEIRGLAWSGRGVITKVEVSLDGGKTWNAAELQTPILPKCHTRFRFAWEWNGQEAILQSRCMDETGYLQPTLKQLINVRGTNSYYHNNAIQSWKIDKDGHVHNVQA
ncbi:sulfite dehydrogenase [Candidatus Nitronereus thalassa]|uniref:Sulfite dehydrogenase n=1 Tax=Candidatus Nitronereus thalassa TaxID=3020898 RepID=A0ABU3KBY8_9BACT|nr:sulfite dehydrogenase [Candidatus Nitronereus thalassa]MDT7044030.1 sulfite dehydrogenase [Candidatus Nitronereus thalassa]